VVGGQHSDPVRGATLVLDSVGGGRYLHEHMFDRDRSGEG